MIFFMTASSHYTILGKQESLVGLFDLKIPRIEGSVVGNLVCAHVPLIQLRGAVLKLLGEADDILRGQRQALGRLEIAEALFDRVANLFLLRALGHVRARRVGGGSQSCLIRDKGHKAPET